MPVPILHRAGAESPLPGLAGRADAELAAARRLSELAREHAPGATRLGGRSSPRGLVGPCAAASTRQEPP